MWLFEYKFLFFICFSFRVYVLNITKLPFLSFVFFFCFRIDIFCLFLFWCTGILRVYYTILSVMNEVFFLEFKLKICVFFIYTWQFILCTRNLFACHFVLHSIDSISFFTATVYHKVLKVGVRAVGIFNGTKWSAFHSMWSCILVLW